MYYRSSRSRRREEPQAAAEFGHDQAWMSPARAEGDFRFQKWPNASRVASDSACDTGFSAKENFFALEIRQNSYKKASGIPMKELVDEEVSKEKEIRCPSPSLVARLMGLDALPPSVRQPKNMNGYCQTTSSMDILENYVHPKDCSCQRISDEDQEFKDVFEVTETSKIMQHRNDSNSRRMLSCRGNEAETDLVGQKLMDAKHLLNHEVLQNAEEFNDAFKVPDSSRDLFLELLQDPNCLFAKHLQDPNLAPPSPHRSKITILRPSKGTKLWSNEVCSKPSKSERNPDRCFHMQQEVAGSFKMHAASLGKHSLKENSGSISCNSSASQHADITKTRVHPSRIVILKPNLEKMMAEGNLLTHENFWLSSKKYREIAASGIQELQGEGRQKLSHHTEVLSHMGSTEIAREITRKMRHAISSRVRKKLASEMNPYAGNGDPFILSGIAKLNHSASIYLSSDHFGECNSFSRSSSCSTESSVSREARKRLCQRWKITHQFQNRRHISQGSSTLGELLALADRETPKVTADTLNTKDASDEKLASDEVFGSKGCPLGISSRDGLKDGISRYLPRSTSLAASCGIPKLSDGKQHGGSSNAMMKGVLDMGPSVSSDAKSSKPGIVLVKSSKHDTHKSQLAHSFGEENTLPEQEIHVNSEGLRKSIHMRNYLNKTTIHPAPTDYAITDRNQLKNGAFIPILGIESWQLTTQEEQAMQSACQVPFGHTQNDIVIEEISSDHPRVEQLPSESDVAEPHLPNFEQPSPVSVLETPSEDETYTSGCFERLSVDLKELRMKLQLLKLESIHRYAEESELLVPSHEDCAVDNHVLLPSGEIHQAFRDDHDRDFAYLLDILVESGIHGVHDNKFLDACSLLSHPEDQNVFNELEKKYDRIASWSRSERKLLFDLINCTLEGLVTTCMVVHRRSKIWPPAWDREGLIEGLWQMVVKQRKELDRNQENKVLEPGWFDLEDDTELIGREMEMMLNDELLEELVSEVILASCYGA